MLDIILAGNQLTVSEFGKIRITDEGWISVYDLISVCSQSDSIYYPSNTWRRLVVSFPEDLSSKCTNLKTHKFKGKGQRITPICSKEKALEIIGLLPGTTGKKYRAIAAKLVHSYLENPEALAELAVERMESLGDVDGLKRHQTRLEGKLKRRQFTDELKDNGVQKGYHFANITNGMTKDVIGKTASQLKTEKSVKNAREAMEEWELAAIGASESLAKALMIRSKSNGYQQCNEQCRKASQTIATSLN